MVKKLIKDGGSPVFGSVRSVEEVSVEGRGDEVGGWSGGGQWRQRLAARRRRHRAQPLARRSHPLALQTRFIHVHYRIRRACWTTTTLQLKSA